MQEINKVLELLNKTQFNNSEEKESFINILKNLESKINSHIDSLIFGEDKHYIWQKNQQELEQKIKDDKKAKYIAGLTEGEKKERIESIYKSNPWSGFVFDNEFGIISVDDLK